MSSSLAGGYQHVATADEHELTPSGTPTLRPYSAAQDSEFNPYNPDNERLDTHYRDDSTVNVLAKAPTSTTRYSTQAALKRKTRRKRLIIIGFVVITIIAAAAAVVLALTLGKKHSSSSSSGSGSSSSGGSSGGSSSSSTSGKSGSIITMEDGTKFTYVNNFGGEWAYDPKNPFAAGGKSQSWSKRVGSEDWVWGSDYVRGVNLGGWLVTEPFIVPALYEKYINNSAGITVVDEWTLSQAMGSNLATEMENHYKTFITEQDFANIAAAGLNWVRIPIGFWAIEAINGEPFLVGTSWTYFLKAIQWARKYGIRINLDLHALPGSQNGWNHSGKSGSVNFMNGVMGIANAERALTYYRILAEFVSQPEYKDVVLILSIVNEILWSTIGEESIKSLYVKAHDTIRKSTGTGAGNGPYIAIHEGFQGPGIWAGFLAGSDRVVLDQHPYLAFMGLTNSTPASSAPKPCAWAIATNQSEQVFGVTIGGEFSTAINACGLWLNGIGSGEDSSCAVWDDWANYTPTVVSGLLEVTLASMDALQNYFFWTWKIGNSSVLGTSSSPMWHYQLGLQQGWVPKDPRQAIGQCGSVLTTSQPFNGNFPSTATGGAGAGTVDPAQSSSYPFPPPTLSPSFSATQMSLLPTYTATGTLKTLAVPTFTAAPKATVGTGWNNPSDNTPAFVPVAGCQYPDAWNAVNATLPSTPCTGS